MMEEGNIFIAKLAQGAIGEEIAALPRQLTHRAVSQDGHEPGRTCETLPQLSYSFCVRSGPDSPARIGVSGDTELARMEVRLGTNVHPRSELLLFGEGIGFSLEHVTRINPAPLRPGAGYPDLSDTGDRQANVPQHSDPGESRPSRSKPDDGSCSMTRPSAA